MIWVFKGVWDMKVDVKRIQNDIETLATFNETPGCGVTDLHTQKKIKWLRNI